MGKSPKERSEQISSGEAQFLWHLLVERYDILETTNLLKTLAKDEDLKMIISKGHKVLLKQINDIEKTMKNYGIPLPLKPPEDISTTNTCNEITDRYIFRRIFRGIQQFLFTHLNCFAKASSDQFREKFRKYLLEELDMFDKLYEYGKMKNYLVQPPTYKI